MQTVLEFHNVSKSFQGRTIISELSLRLSTNQSLCLVGPSGCGKTTIMRLSAGLIEPDPGGWVGWWHDGVQRQQPIRPVAAVFQDQGLLPWRTAKENVALALEIMGADPSTTKDCVENSLRDVDLSNPVDQNKYPHELSGGMRTRVAVARALVTDSPLVLLDEPLVHLDTFSKEELFPIILKLMRDKKHAVLYATHDLEEAVYMSDRILLLQHVEKGQFQEIATPPSWERTPKLRESESFTRVVRELRSCFHK